MMRRTGGAEESVSATSLETQALEEKVLALVGGDKAFVPPILRLLIDTDTSTLDGLLEAFHRSAWDAAAADAHRIAGSLRMLGDPQLVDLMSRFEAALRADKIQEARLLLPQIAESLEHRRVMLQSLLASVAWP